MKPSEPDLGLTREKLVHLYRKRARFYDFTANLYYLLGFREWYYRRRAVNSLCLRPGDTVVELGCGTGLNFRLLEEAVGPQGRIIGVDVTDRMLDIAAGLSKRRSWTNVTLIQSDIATFDFPSEIQGILSSFALTLVPEFDAVVQSGYGVLKSGGHFAILDFRVPDNWRRHLAPLGAFLTSPFGVTMDLASRHPWESLSAHFKSSSYAEFYAGFVYLSVGLREEASCGQSRDPLKR